MQVDLLRSTTLSFDRLVIGGSLEALYYAYIHSLPIVCNRDQVSLPFDFLSQSIDTLASFGVTNDRTCLVSNRGKKEMGNRKVHIYDRLYFVLSIAGLNPFAGQKIGSIRLLDEHMLGINLGPANLVKISFSSAVIFRDAAIEGLGVAKSTVKPKFRVLDWMSVRSCGPHRFDLLEEPREKFVREVFFYPSVRVDGSSNGKDKSYIYKDLVAVSYLSAKELDKEKFSEIYAKFIVLKTMAAAQIRGTIKEHGELGPKYRPIKIDLDSREVHQLTFFDLAAPKTFEILSGSFEDIFNEADCKRSALSSLNQKLFPRM